MKIHFKLCFLVLLFAFNGLAQISSNHSESKYAFEKIAGVEATTVLDQGMSGTCWSFSALSFFESEIIRLKKEQIILSEMFIVRHAYYEKAVKFIRMDGKSNFGEGGAFHDIPYIIKRYGVVPNDVYSGLRPGEERINHKELFNVLDGLVHGVLKTVESLYKNESLSGAWRVALSGVLDAYLGSVPATFKYKGKDYTPKSFADFLKLNMDDYVSITSFTHFPYYESCMLEIPDNWGWGSSYNVPLDDLVRITDHAMRNGFSIAWGADVSEPGFNFREGIAIVPEDPATIQVSGSDNRNFSDAGAVRISNAFREPVKELVITPELRQMGYDNKTTQDDHGMHITGLYKEKGGGLFYLVKNSWGTSNHPQGYLYVSQSYFKHKTINIYLHKDGIPSDVKKKLKLS
jgi:bleomycin hydrolase